jgi:hypothetical protein
MTLMGVRRTPDASDRWGHVYICFPTCSEVPGKLLGSYFFSKEKVLATAVNSPKLASGMIQAGRGV